MSSLIVLEMPGMYGLKPRFQALLRPFARILARLGITANQVTIFACALSIATGLVVFSSQRFFPFLPLVFLIRMALNAVDGILAREFGRQTRLGAHLNELTDVVSDTFLYLPFTQLAGVNPTAMWLVIVFAVISEMAGAVSTMTGGSRRYDGPMGKKRPGPGLQRRGPVDRAGRQTSLSFPDHPVFPVGTNNRQSRSKKS